VEPIARRRFTAITSIGVNTRWLRNRVIPLGLAYPMEFRPIVDDVVDHLPASCAHERQGLEHLRIREFQQQRDLRIGEELQVERMAGQLVQGAAGRWRPSQIGWSSDDQRQ
jgi:hypothetical protein